jgi:hypothetical protein
MTEPTTEAGRLYAPTDCVYGADEWCISHGRPEDSCRSRISVVLAIEAEARAAVLRELREEVYRIERVPGVDDTRELRRGAALAIAAILAAIDRRLGNG